MTNWKCSISTLNFFSPKLMQGFKPWNHPWLHHWINIPVIFPQRSQKRPFLRMLLNLQPNLQNVLVICMSIAASIHLIHLLLTEYMLLAIESQLYIEKDQELQSAFGEHCDASSSPHQNSTSFPRLPPVCTDTTYLPMRFIPGPQYPLYCHHSHHQRHHPHQRRHDSVDGGRQALAGLSDRSSGFDRGNGSNHLSQFNIMLKVIFWSLVK